MIVSPAAGVNVGLVEQLCAMPEPEESTQTSGVSTLWADPNRPAASVPLEILLATVVSVKHEAAAFERSPHAGCVAEGTPEVEIALIHLEVVAASDWIPPSVVAEGLGRSAPTSARNIGAPAPPETGPAKVRLAF